MDIGPLRLPECNGYVGDAAAFGDLLGACAASVVPDAGVVLCGNSENLGPSLREEVLFGEPCVCVALPTGEDGAYCGIAHGKVIQGVYLR